MRYSGLPFTNVTDSTAGNSTTDDITVTSFLNDVINYTSAVDDVSKMAADDPGSLAILSCVLLSLDSCMSWNSTVTSYFDRLCTRHCLSNAIHSNGQNMKSL